MGACEGGGGEHQGGAVGDGGAQQVNVGVQCTDPSSFCHFPAARESHIHEPQRGAVHFKDPREPLAVDHGGWAVAVSGDRHVCTGGHLELRAIEAIHGAGTEGDEDRLARLYE